MFAANSGTRGAPLRGRTSPVSARCNCLLNSNLMKTLRPRFPLPALGPLAASLLLTLALVPLPPARAADVPVNKAWSGTWNNRKYNTSGALTCTVQGEQSGQWIAKFTGTALGKPISYTALMTPKASGANTALTGTTKVDGFAYQWTAVLSGKALNGSYQASNGNNGEFKLQSK